MTRTVEIPGGTAEFREKLSTERLRRPIKRAYLVAASAIAKLPDQEPEKDFNVRQMVESLPLTPDEADSLLGLYDATLLALLESWSLEQPLPTAETLLDLDSDLYDALLSAAAQFDAGSVLQDTDFSPKPPGENPTGDSRSSDLPLTGELESTLTPESSNGGAPIDIDASSPA